MTVLKLAPEVTRTPRSTVRPDQTQLEAYRLIYGDLPAPNTCASETCGRAFWVQEGRSEHGQHRTVGVKFCSKQCASAQTQRARRRRLKGQA